MPWLQPSTIEVSRPAEAFPVGCFGWQAMSILAMLGWSWWLELTGTDWDFLKLWLSIWDIILNNVTWLLWLSIYELGMEWNHPNCYSLSMIFQRGRSTTNQLVLFSTKREQSICTKEVRGLSFPRSVLTAYSCWYRTQDMPQKQTWNLKNTYPLVICYIAIENGPVEIVDVPIKNEWIFP